MPWSAGIVVRYMSPRSLSASVRATSASSSTADGVASENTIFRTVSAPAPSGSFGHAPGGAALAAGGGDAGDRRTQRSAGTAGPAADADADAKAAGAVRSGSGGVRAHVHAPPSANPTARTTAARMRETLNSAAARADKKNGTT